MKAIGVIPARYGSTRLPGKPLKDLCGKPVIQHVYERAASAASLHTVVVATDDRRIVHAVTEFGGRAVMTSANHADGTSRTAEAVRDDDSEVVINIQGDEPFVAPEMINELVAAMQEDPDVPTATLCGRIPADRYDDPDVVKAVFDRNGLALYFSRSIIPYPRNADTQVVYEHIGIYGYRRSFLPVFLRLADTPLSETESLEQLKILEHGHKMKVIRTSVDYNALSIDTEEDLDRARRILQDRM